MGMRPLPGPPRSGRGEVGVPIEIVEDEPDAGRVQRDLAFAQDSRLQAAARSAAVVDDPAGILLDHEIVPDRRDAPVELDLVV